MDVIKSSVFDSWLRGLSDRNARARIEARISRLSLGNPGDSKALGGGLFEMRIDYGPGYLVYFLRESGLVVVLLCGGDKSTQRVDVERARTVATKWKEK